MVQTKNGIWINATGSGAINLIGLVNATTVIGSANLSANTVVSAVKFMVASANIVVNGVTSNVTLPNSTVEAHIVGGGVVNSTGGLLLDFSPTIVSIETTGNTTDYIMVPSIKAVSIGGVTVRRVGERIGLGSNYRKDLEHARANISISSANIISSGSYTSISVTVNDVSNSSVTINHILVFGSYTINMNIPGVHANASVNTSVDEIVNSIGADGRGNAVVGIIGGYDDPMKLYMNTTAEMNSSAESSNSLNESANATLHIYNGGLAGVNAKGNENENSIGSGPMRYQNDHADALNLLVNQNGTLYLPFQFAASDSAENAPGYTIAAGASKTFTFNGIISHGNGIVSITSEPGENYTIAVSGSDGIHTVTTVTAS